MCPPQVEDLSAIAKFPTEPYFNRSDGTFTTRWLNASYPFSISLLST